MIIHYLPKSFKLFIGAIFFLLMAFELSLMLSSPVRADTLTLDSIPASKTIVVKLAPNVSIEAINADYATLVIDARLASQNTYLLQPTYSASRLVHRLNRDQRVELAELNRKEILVEDTISSDPSGAWAWGGYDLAPVTTNAYSDILRLDTAHQLSVGSGVVVAVLDTGFQLDHPYLEASLIAGYDFVDGDADPSDEFNYAAFLGVVNGESLSGHGTHVAGLIHSVAPAADIMPLRVLNETGEGDLFAIAAAVLYAVEHDADVINLSLGTSVNSKYLKYVIDHAVAQGVVVVAAAGNLDTSSKQYPAAYNSVIAVASVDTSLEKSTFSNYGKWVDISAPGEGVYSSYPIDGYAWWSGTSMATALVSGQAALIKSVDDTSNVKTILLTSSRDVQSSYSNKLGSGVIDCTASLFQLPSVSLGQGD